MGKIFLILLILFGAGLYFPESREVIVERSRPLLNPAYRWMSIQQMEQILTDLEEMEATRGNLPLARGAFDTWLEDRYPSESTRTDAWGERYRLEATGDRMRVISAGSDGQFGTEDDLVRERERSQGSRRR